MNADMYVWGFPRWKHPVVRQCFPGKRVRFVPRGTAIPLNATLVVWGMDAGPDQRPDLQIIRMEDGFLRSVGLGADLVRPMSWVADSSGIYYDATRASNLEKILINTRFDTAMLNRAAALRGKIVAAGLTKYNVGAQRWQRPQHATKVILVPGQVESDASLAWGAPGIRTNMGLLQRVRQHNPDAWVVYKPHPDVLAGLRLQGQGEDAAAQYCNEVVTDVNISNLFDAVDELHVLTSLAGFEAILRDKPVVCYGQPFYAGWGLTRDELPHPRRTRRLSVDELVAGVLIEYPLYLSRCGKHRVTPEQALDDLAAWRQRHGGREPWWRELFRMVLRRVAGVR